MIVSLLNLDRPLKTRASGTSVIHWMLLMIMLAPVLRAEDGTTTADAKLDAAKQRSAEERWQRIKKQYSNSPAGSRQTTPSQMAADQQSAQGTVEVPPSPTPTLLIPRMAGLPADHTNDWIVPSPQVIGEEGNTEAGSDGTQPGDAEKAKSRSEMRVAAQDTTPAPTTTPMPTPTPIPTPTPNVEGTDNSVPQRALHERRISDIAPYYDRERDNDIRQFALEKGREIDIEFKPKPYTPRSFPEIVLAWEASNFTYQPLYFSDPALERYGHTHHPLVQPLASIARVGFQFVFLPYQMTITPINKEESTLGWYRPGDAVPKLHYQVPLNLEAAAVETGFVTGLYFMIVP